MTVPEEAVEAAAKVLRCDYATEYDDTNVGWEEFADPARAALAAAVPVIEKQLRARLADEIEAQPQRYRIVGKPESYDPYLEGWDDGMDSAARIVRGEQPVQGRENIPGNIPAARCWYARCDAARRAKLPWPACLCAPFIVCPECGDKRCPRAAWHGEPCVVVRGEQP